MTSLGTRPLLDAVSDPAVGLLAVDEAPNPWFDPSYVTDNWDSILAYTGEHVRLTVLAVLIGAALALPLALVARRSRYLSAPVLGLSTVVYTIPSLALFALLVPFTGLSSNTVLIGLVAYSLVILVRNFLAGLQGVPADVREAARGMGLSGAQTLWRVDLPLALPAIMAGLRIATVSTVALTTVGVLVGHGGLGQLITGGFASNFYRAEIVTGAVGCVLLALLADALLAGAERLLTPWSRAARA
ncbi:ABC transporter permease [Geodermatophilus nigrescens]|uniref:Osmoprotectant transport system permease protein n=1 Tax=Geodermatophilus nigrescens TaxID=1070870 RepID=A0A1M5DN70_9ACTN|nr:ABC transporter permease [Geodermatophilus nigrescens]SHF68427.1 osmoprotectant transport system permease protein [Geodermatophilus nigrescens]